MKNEDRQVLNMWLSQGWNLKSEDKACYILTKNTQKLGIHFLIFILSIWMSGAMVMYGGRGIAGFFMFLGNVIYWLVSRKEKKIMKE